MNDRTNPENLEVDPLNGQAQWAVAPEGDDAGGGLVPFWVERELPISVGMEAWEESPITKLVRATWMPQEGSQEAFLTAYRVAFEVLFEGTRGPGKTDALLMDFFQHVGKGYGAEWRGIVFRRSYPELTDIIAKSKKWFNTMCPAAKYNKVDHTWTFPDGEQLMLRHMSTPDDYWSYHGFGVPWIAFEELCNWPDDKCYKVMMSCSRSTRPDMPRCYRATTNPYGCVPFGEVLTVSRGWVPIQDVLVGEVVVSVRADGTACEATVSHVIAKQWQGDMVLRKGRGMHLECTTDHRLPHLNTDRSAFTVKRFDELPGDAKIKRCADGWDGVSFDTFEVRDAGGRVRRLDQPKTVSEADYAEFMGWFLSEGFASDVSERRQFGISQIKPQHRVTIEALLMRMGFKYRTTDQSFVVSCPDWAGYLARFGKCREKYVPARLKKAPTATLRILLQALMDGDGHWRDGGGSYFSLSKQLADDVAEILVKLGYRVYIQTAPHRLAKEGRVAMRGVSGERAYTVQFSAPSAIALKTGNHLYDVDTHDVTVNVQRCAFDGQVYCLTVPETETFFIRQNGCVWLSGNSGHNWVKTRFGLPRMQGVVRNELTDPLTGAALPPRLAIHGSIYENRILLHVDPDYIQKIRAAARNPSELAAWIDGSWDIVAGGMFDDLYDARVHIVPRVPYHLIPKGWKLDRAFDWGSSKPFAVGWFAESNGEPFWHQGVQYGAIRGDTYMIAEWYGWNGQRNEGLRLPNRDIGEGIRDRENDWGIRDRVKPGPADSSIYDEENGGKSIAKDMLDGGAKFAPADKGPGSRKQGWQIVRKYLDAALQKPGKAREHAGFFIFDCCEQMIELFQGTPRDDKDLDDVDSDAEDHIQDMARYRLRKKLRAARQSTS